MKKVWLFKTIFLFRLPLMGRTVVARYPPQQGAVLVAIKEKEGQKKKTTKKDGSEQSLRLRLKIIKVRSHFSFINE